MPSENRKQSIAFRYNPQLLTEKALADIFVGREHELQAMIKALTKTTPETVPQHILLTGARGMGKTTLLHRLAQLVRKTPALAARWLAPTFPEEQYKVASLADFWLNALDALADDLGRLPRLASEQQVLDREIECLQKLPLAEREEKALQTLLDFLERQDKGVVLLVDGTDRLFSALEKADSGGATGKSSVLWRLRGALSHQPRIFWIGASYLPLEANSEHQYGDAFLDFFQIFELRPFTPDEMRTAMLKLAAEFGMGSGLGGDAACAEMRQRLDKNPERLKALHVLTNGNPRTLIVLYNLFVSSDNEDIHGDLNNLLDLMTPLYQSKMEVLSDQQRVVLAHLMDAWAPQTAQQLAQISGLKVNTINSQLSRLEKQCLVEKVSVLNTRRDAYQASERFFNIWYLMRLSSRRQRNKFIWFIDFMRLWYSSQELGDIAHGYRERLLSGDYSENDISNAAAVISALGEHPEARALYRQMRRTSEKLKEILDDFDIPEDRLFINEQGYRQRFMALDAKLSLCPHAKGEEPAWIEAVKSSLSLSLKEKERVADASEGLSRFQYDELRQVFTDEKKKFKELSGDTACDHVRQAVVRGGFFPDFPEPELVYEQMENCFKDDFWAFKFAIELFAHAHQGEWFSKACQKLMKQTHDSNFPFAIPWNGLGNLLQDHLRRYDEAEVAYRKAIALDEKYAYPWNGLGSLLQDHLQRYDEAEVAYRKAIALNEKFAYPWNGLGNLLQDHLQRYDEAEAAYRKAIALDEKSAYPHANLGNLYSFLRRVDNAKAEYRQALRLADNEEDPHLLLQAHLYLGNRDEAMIALNAMIAGRRDIYRLREQLCECHRIGLGAALAELIEESEYADLLVPYSLALRVAEAGDRRLFNSASVEIATLAKEVFAEVFGEDVAS
jgi:tetratricopeptide (TPR) repeat protein